MRAGRRRRLGRAPMRSEGFGCATSRGATSRGVPQPRRPPAAAQAEAPAAPPVAAPPPSRGDGSSKTGVQVSCPPHGAVCVCRVASTITSEDGEAGVARSVDDEDPGGLRRAEVHDGCVDTAVFSSRSLVRAGRAGRAEHGSLSSAGAAVTGDVDDRRRCDRADGARGVQPRWCAGARRGGVRGGTFSGWTI